MNLCYSRYCVSNFPGTKPPLTKPKYACPYCKTALYCSQKCRELDWTSGHQKSCKAMIRHMLNSQEIQSDKVSTLKNMKRTPAEFDILHEEQDLGKGSFGVVKKVKDRTNGQLYAMKILFKKDIFDYCSIDNLKREIRIQRKLSHPNIVKLHYYFEDKEKVYLVLEYAEMGSLFSYLRRKGRLREEEAFVFFFQTCLGLDYLHKQHIIHRDLKPENLLLSGATEVKICDFGWSVESSTQKRKTFCGTLDYMAPEMIENKPHDHTLDLWCLGVLLFELVHGATPFKAKNQIELCERIVTCKMERFDAAVSQECKLLIQSLLRLNPGERLSLNGVFSSPWMKKNAAFHKVRMENYIYSNDSTYMPMKTNLNASFQDNSYHRLNSFSTNSQTYTFQKQPHSTRNEPEFAPTRFSTRLSNLPPQERKKEGFFEKILISLGCMNREKRNPPPNPPLPQSKHF